MSNPSFYLTLPSNVNQTLFPDNSLASYVTKLPNPIQLEGSWEVALVEVLYTSSFYNVLKEFNELSTPKTGLILSETVSIIDSKTKPGKKSKKIKDSKCYMVKNIPAGNYQSITHLISTINETAICLESRSRLVYDPISGYVRLKSEHESEIGIPTTSLILNKGLADILGFEDAELIFGIGQRPARLDYHVPAQLFIYSDIAEQQIVGDSLVRLLRIVAVDNSKEFGSQIFQTYNAPHYVPVSKNYFDTIEVNIRTNVGEPAPFQQGSLTVKLHLRCLSQMR